ncbi:hypothetical protein P152DRAFT_478646 [Eremomyces bilateralis CBS 781.70]|uniref:Major facilitator superfamily (MFS) profile domain-containing protein n=1 Tax=Eremomyces bilateralis CBS 781.70 TaxID=1392243 RepID=A0A6G1GDR2_9PEZI|nr:uncharacterized protein P152DRAFT_478646 [Eremomyces bilateralis CBS 781.70]KAF1816050.1 hypothetical protein P152DRAFT_478646 [Eremomyces bilateralis CBS 781.70]
MRQGNEKSATPATINFEQATIDNPLKQYSPEVIQQNAIQFAKHFGFPGLEGLFVKAAFCARDPRLAPTVSGLTTEEKDALNAEIQGSVRFWNQPKQLKIAVLTCCLGAILQGWNQTGAAGANLSWPEELGLHIMPGHEDYNISDVFYFSGVNAISYFVAALFGSWISDPVQEILLGRRAAIFFAGLCIFAASIASAFVKSVGGLMAARVVLGIGMGCKASVIPIYSAEIAPAQIRGTLGVNWQIMDALGIALGYAANLIVADIGRVAWRVQFATAVLPTLFLLVLVFCAPESPRYLVKKKQYNKAYRSLLALRESPIIAARDLFYIHVQLLAETRLFSSRRDIGFNVVRNDTDSDLETNSIQTNLEGFGEAETYQDEIDKISYWDRVLQLWKVKRVRRSALASFAVMISQQLCGINVLAFYGSTFFESVNESRYQALWFSLGFGLANFIFALPAYSLVESWGRRPLLLISIPGMMISLIACGSCFYINGDSARIGAVSFFIFVFTFFYSPGVGPIPFATTSEIFMSVNREIGMSFGVFINLFFAGILTILVPPLTRIIGGAGTGIEYSRVQGRILYVFAGLNIIAFLLCYFLVPETSGATISKSAANMEYISLEEMNYIFDTPTRRHVEYQTRIVLPWAISRAMPWRNPLPRPEGLYQWSRYGTIETAEPLNEGGAIGDALSENESSMF